MNILCNFYAFVGPVGPRCQPKASPLACNGRRPAYILVYLKEVQKNCILTTKIVPKMVSKENSRGGRGSMCE